MRLLIRWYKEGPHHRQDLIFREARHWAKLEQLEVLDPLDAADASALLVQQFVVRAGSLACGNLIFL